MNKELIDFTTDRLLRVLILVLTSLVLIFVFVTQRFNYAEFFNLGFSSEWQFMFNRTIRFLINDNIVLLMIYAIFYQKAYVKLGVGVEIFGFFFLLLPYFFLRFYLEVDSSYISFIHRLIINPTLMLLTIPAIFYQQSRKPSS
jgi:exosortase F-associated protein